VHTNNRRAFGWIAAALTVVLIAIVAHLFAQRLVSDQARGVGGGLGLTISGSGELAVRVLTCEAELEKLEILAGTTEPVLEGSNEYVIQGAKADKNRDTVIPLGLTIEAIKAIPAKMKLIIHPYTTTDRTINSISFTRSSIDMLEAGQFMYGDIDNNGADEFNSHNSGDPLTFADSAMFEARFACNG
jgi:hypothetical protein